MTTPNSLGSEILFLVTQPFLNGECPLLYTAPSKTEEEAAACIIKKRKRKCMTHVYNIWPMEKSNNGLRKGKERKKKFPFTIFHSQDLILGSEYIIGEFRVERKGK